MSTFLRSITTKRCAGAPWDGAGEPLPRPCAPASRSVASGVGPFQRCCRSASASQIVSGGGAGGGIMGLVGQAASGVSKLKTGGAV